MTDLSWLEQTWQVRNQIGATAESPGANWWKDTSTFATVSGNNLLLVIAQDAANSNRWTSSEVQSALSYGYGTYEWVITNDPSTWHQNVAVSLMVYSPDEDFNHRQISIDFSRYGDSAPAVNTYYSFMQAANNIVGTRQTTGASTRHRFKWMPGKIEWESYDSTGTRLYRKVYAGTDVPSPGNEKVIMRAWLPDSPSNPPSSTTTITFESFSHTRLGEESGLYTIGVAGATTYSIGAYQANQDSFTVRNRGRATYGAVPLVYCHDAMTDTTVMPQYRLPQYFDEIKNAAAAGMPGLVASLGGLKTYGNDASIASIDSLISYYSALQTAGINMQVAADKVCLWGDGMGALTVLNWAWRNSDTVGAIVLRNPIVALDDFHDRNVSLQSEIETAYGGLSAFNSALPTHDPKQNWGLIRQFGPKIKIWYAAEDDLIPTDEIDEFVNAVGADSTLVLGAGHEDYPDTPNDKTTAWLQQAQKQSLVRHSYSIDWSVGDEWSRLTQAVTSYGSQGPTVPFVYTVAGDQGTQTIASNAGNDRRWFYLNNFDAVNSEMHNVMYGRNGLLGGQQGNAHRLVSRPDGSGDAVVIWQNYFLLSPWILNLGWWQWDSSHNLTTTNQSAGITPTGTRDHVRVRVTAASRTSNVTTYTYTAGDVTMQTGDTVSVTMDSVSAFDAGGTAANVTGTTFQLPNTGANASTTTDGYAYNHTRGLFTPYHLRTILVDNICQWKVWYEPLDEPDWGDPAWSGTHVFPTTNFNSGAGKSAFLLAHNEAELDQGLFEVWEL